MRTILTIASSTLIAAATIMLVWRPVLGFALALIGFCVNLWRLNRQARTAQPRKQEVSRPEPAPAPAPVPPILAEPSAPETPIAETPANDRGPAAVPDPVAAPAFPDDLLARVQAAGWQSAARGSVLYCTQGGVKLALSHVGPAGAQLEDLAAAARLKTRYNVDFFGIVSSARPDGALAAQGMELGVQFVNAARLEAYLAMACSFKPAPARETA